MKRVQPPAYLALSILLMISLHHAVPIRRIVPSPYRSLGWLLIVGSMAIGITVAGIFRRVGTTIVPFEESSKLVTTGLNRLTRNPIYLGMAIGLFGLGIVLGSLTPFLVVPAFALWIDRRFVRPEEAMLEARFGAEYLAYKKRVRRWL